MRKVFSPVMLGEVVNCDYVNVRSKSSDGQYYIVKGNQLKVGTKVELLAIENDRYKITYKGQDGYIYKDYVIC